MNMRVVSEVGGLCLLLFHILSKVKEIYIPIFSKNNSFSMELCNFGYILQSVNFDVINVCVRLLYNLYHWSGPRGICYCEWWLL